MIEEDKSKKIITIRIVKKLIDKLIMISVFLSYNIYKYY